MKIKKKHILNETRWMIDEAKEQYNRAKKNYEKDLKERIESLTDCKRKEEMRNKIYEILNFIKVNEEAKKTSLNEIYYICMIKNQTMEMKNE